MKIIIKGVDEQSFAIEGQPSDTVKALKLTVQTLKKIPQEQQRLFFWGRELDDNHTLSSCDIQNESILHLAVRMPKGMQIVVEANGKSTAITTLPSDTVKSIKFTIQNIEGYPHAQQQLFFLGAELEDDHTLSSYNIQTDSIINLVLRAVDSSRMQIYVKTLAGKTASLDVAPSDTIKVIKAKIKEQLDILPEAQHLVFIDKPLENTRTLSSYDIKNGSVVFLVFRLLGGAYILA